MKEVERVFVGAFIVLCCFVIGVAYAVAGNVDLSHTIHRDGPVTVYGATENYEIADPSRREGWSLPDGRYRWEFVTASGKKKPRFFVVKNGNAETISERNTAAMINYGGKEYVIQVLVPWWTPREGLTQKMIDGGTYGVLVAEIAPEGGIASYVTDYALASNILMAWKLKQGLYGLYGEDASGGKLGLDVSIAGCLELRRAEILGYFSKIMAKELVGVSATIPIVDKKITLVSYTFEEVLNRYQWICQNVYSCNLDPKKLSEFSVWTAKTTVSPSAVASWSAMHVLPEAIKLAIKSHSWQVVKAGSWQMAKSWSAVSIIGSAIGSYLEGQALQMGDFSYWAEMMKKSAEEAVAFAKETVPDDSEKLKLSTEDDLERAYYGYYSTILAAKLYFEYAVKFWEFADGHAVSMVDKTFATQWAVDTQSALNTAKDNLKILSTWVERFNKTFINATFKDVYAGIDTLTLGEQAVATPGSLEDGLIAYYPLDGDVKDKGTKGNHGRAYGKIAFIEGVTGQAVNLDGKDDYIDISAISDDINLSENTIALWFKPVSPGGGLYAQWHRHYIAYNDKKVAARACVGKRDAGTSKSHGFSYETDLQTDQWYHVALSFKSGDKAVFYFNGEKISEETVEKDGLSFFGQQFDLGSVKDYKPRRFAKGGLDEVRIYNRALSESEISELAGSGK